jgi:DNA-binding NarL/FixJ family response regulator
VTTFDHDEYLYDAVRAGASGSLLKNVSPSHLVHAVRTVAAGDALLDPALTRKLLDEFTRRPPPGARAPERLTELADRELDVLRLVARGLSNSEIAQAVVLAYETGLIRPGDT